MGRGRGGEVCAVGIGPPLDRVGGGISHRHAVVGGGVIARGDRGVGGMHMGVLVNGVVYDNNVPFGVPQDMWENYGYYVIALITQEELTLRQADEKKKRGNYFPRI